MTSMNSMTSTDNRVPLRGWVVTFAGTAVNLCLGILYAWSVWKRILIAGADNPVGSAMTGINEGWTYLTDAQGTWAYVVCGLTFALCMIPGGRLQDRFGPKVGATLAGLFLGAGCILAGLLRSYSGLIVGFGLLGGVGMGLGYSAATPAAVKWFGPHRRGLVVGIVVAGFGAAAIYIAPLAEWLIGQFGLSGSFVGLGILFAVVVIAAGQLLTFPPAGYKPPLKAAASEPDSRRAAMTRGDWSAPAMVRTWQYYALVLLFFGSAQSGLLVIANASPLLKQLVVTQHEEGMFGFLASHLWLLASYGGLMNAAGRVGTGSYSDKIGRRNAFLINGLLAAVCMALIPSLTKQGNVVGLFLAVGVAYWQYGGGLSLMPAMTADFFGSKNLGFNYGLVFLGWGIAFLMPQLAGYIKDLTGGMDNAFYVSASLLILAAVASRFVARPLAAGETA